MAVFVYNEHLTFLIQMAMFAHSERKTVFKITVQEINTLNRCHNGSCFAVLRLFAGF